MKTTAKATLIRRAAPWIGLLLLSSSSINAQVTMSDAGKELYKAYKTAQKPNKRAQAFLDIARIYESPLRQYESAIDFYENAVAEARKMSKKGETIANAATTGRQRAAQAWLDSLEGSVAVLEMTAKPATKYYSGPSFRNASPSGVKLVKPEYLTVEEFKNGYCRALIRQGAITKDGWFRLDNVDGFRHLPGSEPTAIEVFRRYEYFIANQPGLGDERMISLRTDEFFFIHARNSGEAATYQEYLSRFPTGVHREDILRLIEEDAFQRAEKGKDRALYEAYLTTYPSGVYASAARDAIEDIEFAECQSKATCSDYLKTYPAGRHVAQTQERLEAFLFEDAKKSGKIPALRSFIDQYPDGHFVEKALEEIDRLTFEPYRETNTISGFQEFVRNYPNSQYVAEAKKLVNAIEFAPYRKRDTIEGYLDFLDKFPDGHYRSEAQERIDFLQYEPYTQRNSISEYEDFLTLFPKNRNAFAARQAIGRLRTEHVKRKVRELSAENRRLGNKYDVTFRGFSNGTLTVGIPELSTGGQLLRLFVGGINDVEDTQRRYNRWKKSIVDRLYTIDGVKKVQVVN